MEPVTLRSKLHQYIDKGDDKLLKIMYMVAKEYNEEPDDAGEYSFSTDDMQLFEERRQKRLSGESKTYEWSEAKNMVIGKIDNVNINSVFHTSRLSRYQIVISYMQ